MLNGSIRQLKPKGESARSDSVFIIRGGNVEDPPLFCQASKLAIEHFLRQGLTVYLLEVDLEMDYIRDGNLPERKLGQLVQHALLSIPDLTRIQFYAHAREDINLSYPGAELSLIPIAERSPDPYNAHRVYVGDLRIGHPASRMGWIDMFTCMREPYARWPQLIADTLGWPVRTVRPGYSIYFPTQVGYPRSQIAGNRLLRMRQYDPHGWALWLPGWDDFLIINEPHSEEFMSVDLAVAQSSRRLKLGKVLDPFREWRRAWSRSRVWKSLEHRARDKR